MQFGAQASGIAIAHLTSRLKKETYLYDYRNRADNGADQNHG
jgi:hypothetical protein